MLDSMTTILQKYAGVYDLWFWLLLACLYKCLTCVNGTECIDCEVNSVTHRTFDETGKLCVCDASYYESVV